MVQLHQAAWRADDQGGARPQDTGDGTGVGIEGLLGSKVNPWARRVIIRVINVIPTSIAITLGYDPLLLLVYSQVVLSLLIPLPLIPLIPLIYYTSRKKFMGQFVNRYSITILAIVVASTIVVLNAALLSTIV